MPPPKRPTAVDATLVDADNQVVTETGQKLKRRRVVIHSDDKVEAIGRLLDRVKVASLKEALKFGRNATVLDVRWRDNDTEQADEVPNSGTGFHIFQEWLRFQAGRLHTALEELAPELAPVTTSVAASHAASHTASHAANAPRTVVVHCHQGRSRSPLVVVAYLRIYKGVDMDGAMTAYEVLRRRVEATGDFGKKTDATKFLASLESLVSQHLVSR